jgi:hypothetical protein
MDERHGNIFKDIISGYDMVRGTSTEPSVGSMSSLNPTPAYNYLTYSPNGEGFKISMTHPKMPTTPLLVYNNPFELYLELMNS